MTLHDPASIQINDCVTRGRNYKKQQTDMFSKIIIVNFFVLFYTQSICHGISTTEDYTDVPTLLNIESTTEEVSSTQQHNDIKSNDIEIPTNRSSSSIVFKDVPKSIKTTFGSSVSLECRTVESVSECQWSWRPFSPVNTPENQSNNSSDNSTFLPFLSIQSLPVSRFPPHNSNDCTLKFDNIRYKQIGYWTCAVRHLSNDSFVSTEPATLSIVTEKTELSIIFEEGEDSKETSAGSSTEIICRTKVSVEECQWSWRLFNQTESSDVEIKKFPAFGSNKTDCSIKLKNFLAEQEGLWTCGARIDENTSFVKSKPIRFFVSEVEFVQLSKGIQIAAGKSALLKCLVNKPVVQCEWSWKPLNSSKEPTVIKNFEPNSDNQHECTVKFKSVLYKEEGFWTCGIRLTKSGQLHEAPPAILRLLPSTSNSRFLEAPKNSSVVVSTQETLKCIANDYVEKCNWLWRSFTTDSKITVVREFPPIDTFRRNCSLNFPQVRIEDQGYWACRLTLASSNTVFTSPFVKFSVYEQDQVGFSEFTKDIQVFSDRKVYLRCVASAKVEQCRWSLTPKNSNTTVVVKQFVPANKDRDCSVCLSHARAEQEGLWTCGIKVHGRETYIEAPPAELSLLETETISMISVIRHHEITTLACKMYPLPLLTSCLWTHTFDDGQDNLEKMYHRLRQNVKLNYTSGICSLQFKAESSDAGLWTCKFIVKVDNDTIELGNASVTIFISQTEDERLGWIVGTITTLILFLMIFIVVLVVCKTRLFSRNKSRILETASKTDSHDNKGFSSTPVLNSITRNSDNHQDKSNQRPSRLYENFAIK